MTPLGIVEGFFGPTWSWPERRRVMQTLSSRGYVRYLYAPKGDAALRRDWEAEYDSAWLQSIASFAKDCESCGVEFGVGISPYGLAENFSLSRLSTQQARAIGLTEAGAKCIAILFDDMESRVPLLAKVQLDIVEAVRAAVPRAKLIVCPSYYSDDPTLDRVFGARDADYLAMLGEGLASNIEMFWTGPEVCSREISVSHVSRVGALLRRKPTLWDNYPVNDGPRMSTQLHLRGFTGRSHRIASRIASHFINPALQPTLSLIPALTLAEVYARGDEYDYVEAFDRACHDVLDAKLARMMKEDVLRMQDVGLHRLGDQKEVLQTRYSEISHPAAAEILRWLAGHYQVNAEMVQTQ